MTGWGLPREAVIGENTYAIHTDYRQILRIFSWLQREEYPEFLRWRIALALFYDEQIPDQDFQEAADYFRRFVNCGQAETDKPGPRLLDWEQDAQEIWSSQMAVVQQALASARILANDIHAIGSTIATHIGPSVFGLAFVEEE